MPTLSTVAGSRGWWLLSREGLLLPLAVAALVAFVPAARSTAQTLVVTDGDGSPIAAVPLRVDAGARYIAASDASELLDGDAFPVKARYRYVAPTRTVTLRLERDDGTLMIRMVAGNREVAVSDRAPIVLKNAPMAGAGDLWIPMEFMVRVVPELIPVSLEYDASRNRLVVNPRSAQPQAESPDREPTPAAPTTAPGGDIPYFSTSPRRAAWTGLVVVLDPGHGGDDLGVQGNGLVEKDDALRLAREIANVAQSVDARAFLTRLADENVSRDGRSQAATQRRATAYIALHFNSSLSSAKSGYRLAINNPESATSEGSSTPSSIRRSALVESRHLADALEAALKAAGFDGERLELPLATIPDLPVAAVHLEMAYVTNPVEAALWQDPRTRRYAAEAIWSGLARYRP